MCGVWRLRVRWVRGGSRVGVECGEMEGEGLARGRKEGKSIIG